MAKKDNPEQRLKEYQALKAQVDKLRSRSDQATGAYQQVLQQLKAEFDCDDIGEAEVLLARSIEGLKKADKKFNKQLAKFKETWADVLT